MSQIPPEGIFKSYDIRGIYPDQLNEDNVVPTTRAIFNPQACQAPAGSHEPSPTPQRQA